MKFKVGDKVRVLKVATQAEGDEVSGYAEPSGLVGYVTDTRANLPFWPYAVSFSHPGAGDKQYPPCFAESELEAAA